MKKKSSCLSTALVIFILILLILVVIATAWFVYAIPKQAQEIYGPAATNLEFTDKIYLSTRLLWQKDDLIQARDLPNESQIFEIQLGDSTYNISQHLQDLNIIPNARAFRDYLVFSGKDTSIQAGKYSLNARMSPIEVAHALQDATPQQITFAILAGWRLEEIAAVLPTSGFTFSTEDFLSAAQHPSIAYPLLHYLPEDASLEGFLFPDRYLVDRDASLEEFLTTILDNFTLKVNQSLLDGFARQGLDLYQAVTLASLVQRESIVEEEMRMIASVFLNRLSSGMKLESDPSVQYALGFQPGSQTWWKNPLALIDLEIVSPYNTYLYPGLMPGPIANPSLNALVAVAQPEQSPYYYFRAACDGSGRHNFAQTFEEHKANACP